VECPKGCVDCYTDPNPYNDEGVICLECSEINEYLDKERGCVEECAPGWYADDLFKWCVKCSCECETCLGNRENCQTCTGLAELNTQGECEVLSSREPYALYADDWASFTFTYPQAAFYIGHRSDFINYPNTPVTTCKDEILDIDWNNSGFADDLLEIRKKILEMPSLNQEEKDKLIELEAWNIELPVGTWRYYHNSDAEANTVNKLKLLYSVADSIFGSLRTETSYETISHDALAAMINFDVEDLCDQMFVDDTDVRLGSARRCKYDVAASCDRDRVNNLADTACTEYTSVINVVMDLDSADFKPNMQLMVAPVFYHPDTTASSYTNSPLAPFPVQVDPSLTPILIGGSMYLNDRMASMFAEANCDSGLHVDWT
jgi:hypothetical protein